MISFISSGSMVPSPLTSYMLKAHSSFCSGLPDDVMLIACRNSCGVVWCGVVWCGAVWCDLVWCGVVWCGVVLECYGIV